MGESQLIESWLGIVIVIATLFGAVLATVKGYFSKPQNGHAVRAGSVFFDSSIGRDIVSELKRLTDTIERIERQMKQTADAEEVARKIAAAVDAERNRWERERFEGDRNG